MKLFQALLPALALACAVANVNASVILTFDEFGNFVPVTNQYQTLGVAVQNVTTVVSFLASPAVPNTPPNLAFSSEGLARFTLDQTIQGDISRVSVYVYNYIANDPVTVSYFGFDNILLGTEVRLTPGVLSFVEFTSGLGPIGSVTITGSGADYAFDTLSFISADVADVPEPASFALLGLGLTGLAMARRRRAK